MKFQSSAAFEKHLKESIPHHLAPVYLFISPCDYEKRLWIDHFQALWDHPPVVRFHAVDDSVASILDEVRTPNLWGGKRMIVVEQMDKAKPITPFLELLRSFSPEVVVILTAAAGRALAELYQKGKKEVIVLDVSEEKPWDRERRLKEWMREEARKHGKELSPDVAAEMIALLGTDLATLHQELKKLITYVGERKFFEKDDVESIVGSRDLLTGWMLAEALVWKHPVALQEKMGDLGFVFPFVGQVRYHFQLGAQLADLLERKIALHEIKKIITRPQNLDKFIPIAVARGTRFFLNGLVQLYHFELSAKSASLDLGVAFDRFQCRIHRS